MGWWWFGRAGRLVCGRVLFRASFLKAGVCFWRVLKDTGHLLE